ncbi:PREDICTED: CD209 antigen-like protein 2 isoform X2 [Rhinopithecus bieti]|uniref:CD209 antigen-like protein 2 isoform X2 n=1 Tax=Rhinopithecus bieti TaxID=61621 RepID=UPI00083C3767|nr:PREDICTED: CD209 antigen-like protein 2 isoform X2 [Rhinopithecus bieti]
MSDSKEPRAQPLGLLEEEELITSGMNFFPRDFGFRQTRGYKSLAVSKNPSSQRLEQSKQDEISQDLSQLKAAVERLCRPCPWEWTFFQGNCYFMSNSQRNWHDSITACQEVGAQLVVIKSAEEQNFLQLQSSRSNRFTWMGLSDLNQEGTWQWVDDSPLSTRVFGLPCVAAVSPEALSHPCQLPSAQFLSTSPCTPLTGDLLVARVRPAGWKHQGIHSPSQPMAPREGMEAGCNHFHPHILLSFMHLFHLAVSELYLL